MQTHTIEVSTPDGPMPVYEAVPDDPRAAVVVVQEAFGVNDHIEDVTRRFAGAGYHAVAPHLFHRSGGGTASYEDLDTVIRFFSGIDDQTILTDLGAAVAHLRSAGFAEESIGLVGFCMGGRATFLAAVTWELGAAVGFYGGGIVTSRFPQFPALIDRTPELRTPWLGLFGDKDESIPVDDVERLRRTLPSAPADSEVVRYPEAEHGFHCDQRASYHEEAAKDAWARTLAWLDAHLAG